MKLEYKNVFSLPIVFLCILFLCIGSIGVNRYLKQSVPEKFEVKAEFSGPKDYGKICKTKDGMFVYRINKKASSAMIIACNNSMMESPKSKIVVPESIEGYKVTVIDELAFTFDEFLVEVELPESIQKIERGIVDCSPKIQKIIIKGNPKEVSEYAFLNFHGVVYTEKEGAAWNVAMEQGIEVKEI